MSHAAQFKNRVVRDLAWVIQSPPLTSGIKNNVTWLDQVFCNQEFEDCLEALINLDKNPSPLLDHLDKLKSKRLGYRFEAFVNFWLQISPNYDLVDHNIQIIENKRTLGEIDFIIRDKRSLKTIHLEVAVKFYLGVEPFEDSFRWFGTNIQDQLGKKLAHLQEHQTQLTIKYPDYLVHNINEYYCLVKGRLYYPFGSDTAPKNTSNNHLRGRWIKQKDLHEESSLKDLELYPIEKVEWLSQLTSYDLDNREIFEDLEPLKKAQSCIATKNNDQTNLEEVSRIFVLPDDFHFPEAKKN